jgi:putative transposase
MNKAYGLKQHANKGKVLKVIQTVRHYRKTAELIASEQWKGFFTYRQFQKNLDIKHVASALSERYKQTCQYQVVGILDSFIANRQNDYADMVRKSLLNDVTRHKLLLINVWRLWFKTEPFSVLKYKLEIDHDTLKLARKIFKHILVRHRKPSFRRMNMALDSKVALISEKNPEGAKSFDYWIRLSTTEKGYPSYIPVSTNGHYQGIPGKRRNFCQINLSDDNELSISFIKDVSQKTDYVPQTPKVALDIGLSTLLATDKGDLLGRSFFGSLKKYDFLISELAANRQRQGFRMRSKKYDSLVHNVREFVKNEINRVLNRVINLYKPAEIVVERLDFRSPELSRRMNRLISWFGKSVIKKKLGSLAEGYKIVITYINPAYTSQECSVCGYVDKRNRMRQSEFKCKCCNSGVHADVNAGRNHLARSSDEVIDVYKSKETVLRILTGRFLSRAERIPRLYSRAKDLLPGNPYFKDALAQYKGFLWQ